MPKTFHVLVTCAFVAACSSDDSNVGDASIDQTSDSTSDVQTKDVTVDAPKDASVTDASDAGVDANDASVDASDDAADASDASDASEDAAIDAPDDVIAITCTTNTQCGTGDFCEKATANCNGKGACTLKPSFCNQLFNPVCGCDKVTYANECHAWAQGINVDYTGACE